MRENWKTCKNCLQKFKAKSASQKYCGLICKGEFNTKIEKIQHDQLAKSVFAEIKKGRKSQEEISKILEIPIASVNKIVPYHISDIQQWYEQLIQDFKKNENSILPEESKKFHKYLKD